MSEDKVRATEEFEESRQAGHDMLDLLEGWIFDARLTLDRGNEFWPGSFESNLVGVEEAIRAAMAAREEADDGGGGTDE
jgi:hypothetical protein